MIISLIVVSISNSQSVNLSSFASSFNTPVEIVNAGDNRLFVLEQAGVIKILNSDGSVNQTPFLDISSIVGSGGERGLLGLAFPPDYTTSGRFFVNYTDNSSTQTPNTVIARYTVSSNPNIANNNGTIILTYRQPFGNHNAGKLAFGPDGLLYISSGDGGSGGDPGDRAQNTTTLLGKILRIDVSGSAYTIPNTNPFSSSANGPSDPRPEVYAIGLRNPWKFSFDKINGDLWIADVGQNNFEEINKVNHIGNPGDNYGWRCFEGNTAFSNSGSCPLTGGFASTIPPVATYPHEGNGCSGSITGGYVYRGNKYPGFTGKYFFAEFCKQTIGILTESNTNSWTLQFQTPNITSNWTTLGEDNNGELYIAGGSVIYKIEDSNLSIKDNNSSNFNLYPNPAANTVRLDLSKIKTRAKNIAIFDILGKRINTIESNLNQVITLPLNTYDSGLYFIQVNLENGSNFIKKLIIK